MATTISSAGTGPVTTQGVGSGLDIAGIVDKLMGVEQIPLNRLKSQEAAYQTKLSAYGAARGALASFQASVATLADPKAFASFATTIGDATLASVAIDAAQSDALSAGTHTLRVDRLASAQRIASSAFAEPSTIVGSGALTIEIGSWNSAYTSFTPNADAGSKVITIDSSNNTLVGIRDAINRADAGVSAAIINDGTGSRLVLSGTATGDARGFRVTAADGDGGNLDASGLSQVAFDPTAAGGTPQTRHLADAANANFSIDGLAISKADNHVTDALGGLAIDLKKVDAAATTFTIARDTAAAKKNITNFVAAYNNIVANLTSLTGYDASTKSAGILNGDSSLRLIASRLQTLVASVIPTGGSVTLLADIGVKFNNTGKLDVDDAKLTSALNGDPASVSRLFATTGVASDALVGFTGSSAKTQIGNHALTVSQLATRGKLAGSAAAGLTIAAGVNDTVAVTIDSVPTTITLAPGSYASAAALATEVQAKINGTSAVRAAGSSVTVGESGGVLTLTSQRYGSASTIELGGGNGTDNLFGSAPAATAGLDVAGALAGAAFAGNGQTATGAIATAAEGLKLAIVGGATGARGNIDFNRGIAARLNEVLGQFLDADQGLVSAATHTISLNITDLQKREDAWTPRLAAIRARYTAQYNAMDALVASLNSTSTYLTQQLTALRDSLKSNNN